MPPGIDVDVTRINLEEFRQELRIAMRQEPENSILSQAIVSAFVTPNESPNYEDNRLRCQSCSGRNLSVET